MAAGGKGRKTTPKTPKTVTTTKKRTARKTSKHPTPELVSLLSTATSAAYSFLLRHENHLHPPQIFSLESLLSSISSHFPSPSRPLPFHSSSPFFPSFVSAFYAPLDPHWLRFFRMSQQTFSHLLHTLFSALSSSLPSIPPDSALAAALFRLSHGASYKSLARRFGFPSSDDACRVFYTVCKAINENLGNLVEFRENLERIVMLSLLVASRKNGVVQTKFIGWWKEECIEFLPYVIVTGCLLHNFLIKFSEPLPDDDVGCLKEEELPVFEGEVGETGRGIRDFLAEHLSRVSLRR
ncbi:hypothetical protein JRO89_XS03G0282900 [Xanthoceras sorbifolium]|uniref:DDE Tnp4 domain-containing protein n=1 Tax=Xanthoceras sorbifolium TaxID=99658 RepID=A0ABQ8ICE3_9ROSI|nr:hypothetical protein JRO89_XS03G0282900 [Xanthoceras sorbifolium]